MRQFKCVKWVSVALILLMCLPLVSCSSNGKDLNYQTNVKVITGGGFESDGTCSVTGIGSFEGNDLEIPSKHKFSDVFWDWLKPGLPRVTWERIPLLLEYLKNWEVTEIASEAFMDCTQLESVEMPDTITEIGEKAFAGCSNLKTIVLSENISSIGANAFDGCPTELFTEHEGAYYLGNESNPYLALIRVIDTNVTSVEIHEDTKLIADAAFDGCESITYLSVPDTSIMIPSGTFDNCINLQNVQLPEAQGLDYVLNEDGTSYSVSGIGSCEMVYFSIPTAHEGLPVTGIADGAFGYDLEQRNELNKQYRVYAKNCKAEGITDADQVRQGFIEEFGSEYFDMERIENIEIIVLHSGIASIGVNAFTGIQVIVSQENSEYRTENGCLIHVPTKTLLKGCDAGVIPEGIAVIGERAFSNLGIESIVIPDSVTSIGDHAFYGCGLLQSVTLGNGVTSIGDRAFAGCGLLQSVTLGNGVTSIGAAAFAECDSLTSIEIPDGVTKIESETFMSCGSLMNVDLPDSLSYIGYAAFQSCTALEMIVIPETVTGIGQSAFESSAVWYVQCLSDIDRDELNAAFRPCVLIVDDENNLLTQSYTNSKYVLTEDGFFYNKYDQDGQLDESRYTLYAYIGSENTVMLPLTIEDNAYEIIDFRTFSENVVIPHGFEVIDGYAFSKCDELKSITIPDSVTSIGEYAFDNCTGLTSVNIGNGVTSIGEYAFYNCTGLTSVTIPDSVTSIGDRAFNKCTGLTDVYFTGTEEEWAAIVVEGSNEALATATIHYNYVPEE